MNKCVETDNQALLKLKHGFVDGSHILSSWSGEDCCKWKGISCNNLTGRVNRLDLQFSDYSAQLEGKIDSSICELQHLTFLDVSFNDLQGEIPKCIGSLTQLIELKLPGNEFVGSVPRTLANLSNLQNLDLRDNNNLVANGLEWLSHLSNLRYLGLSNVNLSRVVDWPSSISRIPSLLELYLDVCRLPQVNPKSISHLNSSTSLQIISFTSNELDSSILSWVLNVSKVFTSLDLSHNSLHSVPDGFANITLCQVKRLSLSHNKLSGQLSDYLPESCSAQHDLEELDLSHNPFSSGPLPDFSWFSSLKRLSLEYTNVVGQLSISFDHLRSLEDLDVSHNQLSGPIPYTIGQLSNLTHLYLCSNKLNGSISEAHLSGLSRLKTLDVSRNSLSFNLDPNWVPPFQLGWLSASSCILGPQFPTWLKYQRKLRVLQISNTGIKDSFPKWFWNISSTLSYLNVSHNKLSGVLPKSSESIKTEHTRDRNNILDFSFNNLSGSLPIFSSNLYVLLLSNNMFSGSLSSLCAISPVSLAFLDLSSNILAGSLPDCWEKFKSLEVLNLENNNLSGRIPKSFGTLRKIKSMHLNNNNFSGKIPSLTLCKSLKVIDFGDNIIEGTLPTWVGHNLLDLIVFSLRGNKIQGSIPTSLCNLLFLQVLDLSTNNITGEIPQCLSRIAALSNMEFQRSFILYFRDGYSDDTSSLPSIEITVMLAWKGQNREFWKNLGLMTIIDLSDNHLTGGIPQSITKLVALIGLNLSGNNLTGFIPNDIGHMKMLETFDLSRNHLHGRMPKSFSNLSFLSYMNLSFNNLSGKITVSTQLQSFTAASYAGNIGLCGPPLTNLCSEDVVPPYGIIDKSDSNEDEHELVDIGFYISLGLGFSAGFCGVCGTLIIKSSWRHAYFQFFNHINDWIYVTIIIFWVTMKRKFQIQP